MALTTTTLSGACAAGDHTISVTSATGFAANDVLQIDNEFCLIANSYISGTTIPLVARGYNGSVQEAHVSGANVTVGLPSDFSNPNATVSTAYALSGKRFKKVSYSASGAITLPLAGEDVFAILNGTTGLAMTVAPPSKDSDGSFLWISSNGAATTHTITFTGGLSGAGTSYDVATVNTTAPVTLCVVAVNGLWQMPITVALAGTLTALTATIG